MDFQSDLGSQSRCPNRYGIWGEWDNPYRTLAPEYEDAQIDVFGKMFFRATFIEAINNRKGVRCGW